MWKSIATYLKIYCYNGVLMESPSHSRKLKNISLIISGIFLRKENIYAKYNKIRKIKKSLMKKYQK